MAIQKPRPQAPKVPMIYLAFIVLMIGFYFFQNIPLQQSTIPYSLFKQQVRNGVVDSVVFDGEKITGNYKADKVGASEMAKRFITIKPPIEDAQLIQELEKARVNIEGKSQTPGLLMTIFANLLPWILIIGFFVWSSRKMRDRMGDITGGGLLPGKNKKFKPATSDIKFDDVAGVENAKRDLMEIVDFLRSPEKYKDIGATLPKGLLLMGPPGTGKTLLARAAAGEAGVPFFSLSGSEFIELYVGMGASRVRELFSNARKSAPAIIFIDEIDSIGRTRGTGLGGGHDEREQTLNQILAEMDGFENHVPVVVMAATNRPDVLDPALTRPGRFDRQVVLDLPLVGAREKILSIHARKVPLADEVNLKKIAQGTVGFSGADLKSLVNEAALFSARKKKEKVDNGDFSDARDKILMGNPREEILSDKDREVIAVHEAGHALVAMLIPGSDPVRKITILPRGRALGFTEQVPEEDKVNVAKTYIEGQIAILLGGRAAEKIVIGEVTTGAENDLKRATKLARKMVMNWGMSENLGYVAWEQGEEHPFLGKELASHKDFSEHTAQLIDEEINRIIAERKNFVFKLVEKNKDKLLLISGELMQKETLEQDQIEELIQEFGDFSNTHQ